MHKISKRYYETLIPPSKESQKKGAGFTKHQSDILTDSHIYAQAVQLKEEDSRKADARIIEKADKSFKTSPILRNVFKKYNCLSHSRR